MNQYYKGTFYPFKPNNIRLNNYSDDRTGLLLPLLFGAAVGFPIGYIASNSNKNQSYYPMMPYYPMNPYYPTMPYQYPY